MANAALTLCQLSQVALAAGISVGFNAVKVECPSLQLIFTFGNAERIRKDESVRGMEAAKAWDIDMPCIREPREIEFPASIRFEPSYDLQKRFTDALLEILP